VQALAGRGRPLSGPDHLDPLLDAIGDRRYVLLGEATHGTSEFYTWRTAISRRLIEEKGFSFIAVEGDWPDCYQVDRFIKSKIGSEASPESVLHAFARWPTWMWANREVVELVRWMRTHNDLHPANRVGFYGLDVYSLWQSMAAVVAFLESADPVAAREARHAYRCFEPYFEDPREYARATALVPASCEDQAVQILRALARRSEEYGRDDPEAFFVAEQNALVAANAERYYRTMVRGGAQSWNVRDIHMVETLGRLMDFHGPHAKAIVWEHNTHIGDARYTDMAGEGMVNVGQLVREAQGEAAAMLVGFGTGQGTVIASDEWEAPMQIMEMPPARRGSIEDLLHRSGGGDRLLLWDNQELAALLDQPLGHRAVGVVYHPEREQLGNYVPTILPRRYDAFMYLETTHAVDPLPLAIIQATEPAETYPTGL
jgi:erythromycin esterase-like protein